MYYLDSVCAVAAHQTEDPKAPLASMLEVIQLHIREGTITNDESLQTYLDTWHANRNFQIRKGLYAALTIVR